MKHSRYILWSWQSNSQELEIDWTGALAHLGKELTDWLHSLDSTEGRCYLYRKDLDHQLVLEVFDPEIDLQLQTRYLSAIR